VTSGLDSLNLKSFEKPTPPTFDKPIEKPAYLADKPQAYNFNQAEKLSVSDSNAGSQMSFQPVSKYTRQLME
jgi:hypothetical protein